MSLVRVLTKKTITPRAPKAGVDVQYPHKWFEANPGSKPVLSAKVATADIAKARNGVKKGVIDKNIQLDCAIALLYLYAKKVTHKLDEEWKSYGIIIGKKDEVVSPLSLLKDEVKFDKEEFGSCGAEESDESWLVGYCLCIYRMTKTNIASYRANIAERITGQLVATNSSAKEVSDVVDLYKGWGNCRAYNTLIAAYDMFFNKFPDHPLANLRIATTGTRHRDCAALLFYGYFMGLMGMEKATDVMDWVFVEQIGTDIDRMMSADDELLDPYSYFPYHVDMGLVTKSAYSATANPHFFEWVHLTGTLIRSIRSMHAKHITDNRASDIFANAAIVAYSYANVYDLRKVYTATGEELNVEDDGETEEDEETIAIKSRDPTLWITLMKTRHGELPRAVKEYVKKIVKGISDPRDGTMEQYLGIIGSTV